MGQPFYNRIIPEHKRTMTFKFSNTIAPNLTRLNLNIPQMIVGYTSENFYYFPYTKGKTYYSPFFNTHNHGSICLGDAYNHLLHEGKILTTAAQSTIQINKNLDFITQMIYSSAWKLERTMGSYYNYTGTTDLVSYGEYVFTPTSDYGQEASYVKFLKKWQRTNTVPLIENTSLMEYHLDTTFKKTKK